MKNKELILLYSMLCIPLRLIPVIIFFLTERYNNYISFLYFFWCILFVYKSFTYHDKQIGFFGGRVWWQNLRIFHALNYLLFNLLVFRNKNYIAKIILVLDLIIGILGFILYKYKVNYLNI